MNFLTDSLVTGQWLVRQKGQNLNQDPLPTELTKQTYNYCPREISILLKYLKGAKHRILITFLCNVPDWQIQKRKNHREHSGLWLNHMVTSVLSTITIRASLLDQIDPSNWYTLTDLSTSPSHSNDRQNKNNNRSDLFSPGKCINEPSVLYPRAQSIFQGPETPENLTAWPCNSPSC